MDGVFETIKKRRSVRDYLDKPVLPGDLDKILEAGLSAPSARNTQNWQFTVVQGKEKLETLRAAVAKAIGNPSYGRFYNAPVLIMVSAPRDYPHAMADCACALENIFLQACAAGLGSVWINQLSGICDQEEVRTLLRSWRVPDSHLVFGCAALGYASGPVPSGRENKGTVVFA